MGEHKKTRHNCLRCGKEFWRRKRRTVISTSGNRHDQCLYCSRQCGGRGRERPPAQRKLHPFACGYLSWLLSWRHCSECSAYTLRKTCSVECDRARKRRKFKEQFTGVPRKEYECERCGTLFVRQCGYVENKECVLCSKCIKWKHNKTGKLNRDKRVKAQQAGDRINPMTVFRHDKWICQMCGIDCKFKPAPHPHCATIDHIVPLSKGGAHSYQNVQTLCHTCNSSKSDNSTNVAKYPILRSLPGAI